MTQTLDSIAAEVPRDYWHRPLVQPPEGGKLIAYTRCTTYVGCLEDTFKLGQWLQRHVAIGLSLRPDLLTAAAAHRDDRDRLDEICTAAREAAAASAGATTGTALHALTEQHDRGLDIGPLPESVQRDLDAYVRATQHLTARHIERFCVLDELKIGGTPDRVVDDGGPKLKIADVKTGNIEYGIGKIAMQLAVYARAQLYDPQTHERTPLHDVDLDRAIVIHLPAGTGTCELVEVDIGAGWQAVQIATRVRGWRKQRFANLAKSIVRAEGVATTQPPKQPEPDALSDLIAAADSLDALTALWREHAHDWKPEHTEIARARKALLAQHVV